MMKSSSQEGESVKWIRIHCSRQDDANNNQPFAKLNKDTHFQIAWMIEAIISTTTKCASQFFVVVQKADKKDEEAHFNLYNNVMMLIQKISTRMLLFFQLS